MQQDKDREVSYLTQLEVASRFRVSQSTVINWRKKRLLDYFQAPGSTKVLYPAAAVNDFENRSIHKIEGVVKQKIIAKKSPEISTITTREWRI
jgi:transcriptional regulator with XRE-family HTH domain